MLYIIAIKNQRLFIGIYPHCVMCRELREKLDYFAYIIASAFHSYYTHTCQGAQQPGQKYGQFYEHVHLGATNSSLRG